MKKLIVLLVTISMAMSFFNSCKKGTNDPSISLRSRDARLIQKWKLTGMTSTVTSVDTNTIGTTFTTITTTKTFDGTTLSSTMSITNGTTGTTNSTTATSTGSYLLTINKDGTVSYTQTYKATGVPLETNTGTGTWNWLDAKKSKTDLMLYLNADYNTSFDFLPTNNPEECTIDKLSEKELVLKVSYSSTFNKNTTTTNMTYTFSQQK